MVDDAFITAKNKRHKSIKRLTVHHNACGNEHSTHLCTVKCTHRRKRAQPHTYMNARAAIINGHHRTLYISNLLH